MKTTILKSIIIPLALTVAMTQASAQSANEDEPAPFNGEEICGMSPDKWPTVVAPSLVGGWTATFGAGTALIRGKTVPIPAGMGGLEFTIFMAGGELAIDNANGVYEMNFVQETFNEADRPDDMKGPSLSDWAFTSVCMDFNKLPRLHISSDEGANVDIYLVVLDANYMVGVATGHMDFGTMGSGTVHRQVYLKRSD